MDEHCRIQATGCINPRILSQPWTRKPKDCCSAFKATAENPCEGRWTVVLTHCNMVGMSLGRCARLIDLMLTEEPVIRVFCIFLSLYVRRRMASRIGLGREEVTIQRGQSCIGHHCPLCGSWWPLLLLYFVYFIEGRLFNLHPIHMSCMNESVYCAVS
ncbi:hypothetical protein COCSADRAFT_262123 [Bipolaris sorokiniana ND90Pr]|uniref:Uncharacterized protein n=1 Tax=Cochliobolus sativus (strain ND90Pr / ATCC 201652) TaxID=665912 RepID=M2RV25_COCSN|nr:uncharacterized protein COCSADRAFT_262123 [Bipolaris sorokiniana ND90Pr]EMD58963.1 hypothetical protein COCSADRAFT_262123 [Bipolaris sorokiniana ND90Pr]